MTSAKKKSASSSPSKDSDQVYLNETHKKMKPIYKSSSTTGLGKRSKSAIIKTTRSPDRPNLKGPEKSSNRKVSEKQVNQKENSHVKKEKKNQSINLGGNKNKLKKKQNNEKEKGGLSKGPSSSVNSSIKKVGSLMHLQLNKKKDSKEYNKASARKSSRNYSKTQTTSAKNSKPMSARDNRKGNIKKKLFDAVLDDQTEILDQKREIEHINLSNLLAQHERDETVKKMIN